MSKEFYCDDEKEDFIEVYSHSNGACSLTTYDGIDSATVRLRPDTLRELGIYCLNQAAIIEAKEV